MTETTVVSVTITRRVNPTKPKSLCSFFAKGNCKKGNACKFLHETPSTDSTSQRTPTAGNPHNSAKLCANWAFGTCPWGNRCSFTHLPRKPLLSEVIQHKETIQVAPNMNDGIYTTTPPFAGLPPLVENGKCRVMGNYVIYFIPFYIPFDGEYLYKKIRLFRFNPSKQVFKLVFSYRYEGFHITTAAATNGYLVCSRLPYDAEVLKLMTTAKKLAKENQFIKQSRSKLQKEVSSLKKKNRSLTVSNLAQRTQISNQNEHIRNLNTQIASNRNKRERPNRNDSGYVASLQNRVLKNIRDRDPVDIFVYHPEQKVMVHVLEYHKPADHVHLDGNILTLYDKPSGRSHIFELTMKTSTVSDYDLSEPLRPSSLCDAF